MKKGRAAGKAAAPYLLRMNFYLVGGTTAALDRGCHTLSDANLSRPVASAAALRCVRLAFRPILLGLGDIGVQPPFADREPGSGHEILIIGKVDLGQAHHREDLA
jgi:hypothetical protein